TFTMGVKAGVDPLILFEAIRQGVIGRRRTFDALIDQFLPGTYDPPAFALRLAHKDVSLATALGRELGVPMRLCNLALEEMTEALNRGWGERDSRAAMLLQQERAGVNIAVDREALSRSLAPDTTAPAWRSPRPAPPSRSAGEPTTSVQGWQLAPVPSPLVGEVGLRASRAQTGRGMLGPWNRHPPPHPSPARGEGADRGALDMCPLS